MCVGKTLEGRQFLSKITSRRHCIVRMRGLPYTATAEQIVCPLRPAPLHSAPLHYVPIACASFACSHLVRTDYECVHSSEKLYQCMPHTLTLLSALTRPGTHAGLEANPAPDSGSDSEAERAPRLCMR